MKRARMGKLLLSVVATVGLLATMGCEPVKNAHRRRRGDHRQLPHRPVQPGSRGPVRVGRARASRTNLPRPTGAFFGMKAIYFDVVDAAGNPVGHQDVHAPRRAHEQRPAVAVLPELARAVRGVGQRAHAHRGAGSARLPGRRQRDVERPLVPPCNESTTARQVYIQYKVAYQPGANASNTRGVVPFFLDVTGYGNSEYNVPGTGGPGSRPREQAGLDGPVQRDAGRRGRPRPRGRHQHRPA